MAPESQNVTPVSILSVDGGGIKGITALGMLQKIMNDVNQDADPAHHKKPCDVFNLICGTSTGGLIAIMLGRLEYTVDQATKKYLELSENIFRKKESRWNATYDHAILESSIKEVVRESPINTARDPELKYRLGKRKCKTFVVTTSLIEDAPQPVVLRDYEIGRQRGASGQAFDGTIWEAARCTSAAPTYFRPITVKTHGGLRTYSDGGTIANNPISEAIVEASRLWQASRIELIVSLGAGPEKENILTNSPANVMGPLTARCLKSVLLKEKYLRIQLATYAVQAMTSTERAHQRAETMVDSYQEPLADPSDSSERRQIYFRLNPRDPAAQVDLDKYREMPKLQRIADEYMERDIVALSYRQVIVQVIKQRLESKQFRTIPFSTPAACNARQIMKKDYRFSVQIDGIQCDPQRNLSVVGRLFSWFRPGMASKPGKASFHAVYNNFQDYNIISEALARRLKYPFDAAPETWVLQQIGWPPDRNLKHTVTTDIVVEIGGSLKFEKVWFFVAEGFDLPCDIILGQVLIGSDEYAEQLEPFRIEAGLNRLNLWGNASLGWEGR